MSGYRTSYALASDLACKSDGAGRHDPAMLVVFPVTLLVALAAQLTAHRIGATNPYWALHTIGSFPAYAVFAVFAIHLLKFADRGEQVLLLGVGLGAVGASGAAFLDQLSALRWSQLSALRWLGASLAAASLLTHMVQWAAGRRSLLEIARMAMDQWLLVVVTSVGPFFLDLSMKVYPTYDQYLLLFEEALGIRISTAAHLLMAELPPLAGVVHLVYVAVPALMALHFALARNGSANLPVLFAVSGAIGFTLYLLYPAVGPDVEYLTYADRVWTHLPLELMQASNRDQVALAPRNSMPSLHAVWGYFLLFNRCGSSGWRRGMFASFGALTLLGALSAGHWFIDLVVALPLALAIQALCDGRLPWRDEVRAVSVAAGALLVTAWFIALQTEWFVAASPGWMRWAAILGTVLASGRLMLRLHRGYEEGRQPRRSAFG